jgi:ArsR family transcriptional regulator
VTSTNLETSAETLAEAFGALADPTRVRVLVMLEAGRRCVCDLQEEIGIAPNLLSYHLRILRDAGLVTAARRGRWVDYELAPALEALRSAIPGGAV